MNIEQVVNNLQATIVDSDPQRQTIGLAMVMCEIVDFVLASSLEQVFESSSLPDDFLHVGWQDWLESEFDPNYDYSDLISHGYDVSNWFPAD